MSDNSDSSVLTKFTRSSSADSTVYFHNMRKEYIRNSNKQNYLFFVGKTTEKRLIYGLLGGTWRGSHEKYAELNTYVCMIGGQNKNMLTIKYKHTYCDFD